MDFRLIRNATLRLGYGGVDFLIDPMLGVRHTIRPMGDSSDRNPTVDLPCSIDEVLGGIDAVIVSHLHPDHFDEAASGWSRVTCRCPARRATVTSSRAPVSTPPNHGEHALPRRRNHARRGEPRERPDPRTHGFGHRPAVPSRRRTSLYWSGDTILNDAVRGTVADAQPDVIVTHSGGASAGGTTIIMDIDDTLEVARLAPSAIVIAVHLEAVAHAPVTRTALRAAADAAGIEPTRLRIPVDGESITLIVVPNRDAVYP